MNYLRAKIERNLPLWQKNQHLELSTYIFLLSSIVFYLLQNHPSTQGDYDNKDDITKAKRKNKEIDVRISKCDPITKIFLKKLAHDIGNPRLISKIEGYIEKSSNISFESIHGYLEVKRELIIVAKAFQTKVLEKKSTQITSVILAGPPGTGKTSLAKGFANYLNIPILSILPTTLGDHYYGNSEKLASAIFYVSLAYNPCVVFIDECEQLFQTGQLDVGNRILNVFKTLWEEPSFKHTIVFVLVTNYPSKLESAMWDRCQKRIWVPLPNRITRSMIIHSHLSFVQTQLKFKMNHMEWNQVIEQTANFSGRTLISTVENAINQVKFDSSTNLTQGDLIEHIQEIKSHGNYNSTFEMIQFEFANLVEDETLPQLFQNDIPIEYLHFLRTKIFSWIDSEIRTSNHDFLLSLVKLLKRMIEFSYPEEDAIIKNILSSLIELLQNFQDFDSNILSEILSIVAISRAVVHLNECIIKEIFETIQTLNISLNCCRVFEAMSVDRSDLNFQICLRLIQILKENQTTNEVFQVICLLFSKNQNWLRFYEMGICQILNLSLYNSDFPIVCGLIEKLAYFEIYHRSLFELGVCEYLLQLLKENTNMELVIESTCQSILRLSTDAKFIEKFQSLGVYKALAKLLDLTLSPTVQIHLCRTIGRLSFKRKVFQDEFYQTNLIETLSSLLKLNKDKQVLSHVARTIGFLASGHHQNIQVQFGKNDVVEFLLKKMKTVKDENILENFSQALYFLSFRNTLNQNKFFEVNGDHILTQRLQETHSPRLMIQICRTIRSVVDSSRKNCEYFINLYPTLIRLIESDDIRVIKEVSQLIEIFSSTNQKLFIVIGGLETCTRIRWKTSITLSIACHLDTSISNLLQ